MDAGINFRRFEPILKSRNFYFGRRLHHKVVVTDVFHCLVAGLNISNRYNDVDGTIPWLDWALYAEGDVADTLTRACIRRFRARIPIRENTVDTKHLKIQADGRDCAVQVRINDWVGRKREITNSYLEMFKTAKSHILIMSPYFLPGELIRRRIKQAVKRGVKITVIQAGISDIAMSKYAERYLYRWLFKNKIEIFEYQKSVLHGKIAVCDGRWITVGSYNVNNLSAYASIELNLDVDNPSFAQKVEHRLLEILEKDCVQITEEVYSKTTHLPEHLLQKAAYNVLRMALFLFTFYFKQKE
jgi:cardiolipin synthase